MPRRDISLVEQVDNPEVLLRKGQRSMANPQNNGNVVPGNEDPTPRRDNNLWDGDRYIGDIANLFVWPTYPYLMGKTGKPVRCG